MCFQVFLLFLGTHSCKFFGPTWIIWENLHISGHLISDLMTFAILNSLPCSLTYFQVLEMFSSVQSLSHVQLFATPWIAAHQASLSITNSQSPPKYVSIESVMPSNHLILSHTLLLLPSIFPSIRVFSNESSVCIRWPKYWSFSFNITQDQWTPRSDLL